jgi:hypothetical protein
VIRNKVKDFRPLAAERLTRRESQGRWLDRSPRAGQSASSPGLRTTRSAPLNSAAIRDRRVDRRRSIGTKRLHRRHGASRCGLRPACGSVSRREGRVHGAELAEGDRERLVGAGQVRQPPDSG